jgi:hypothetical protein
MFQGAYVVSDPVGWQEWTYPIAVVLMSLPKVILSTRNPKYNAGIRHYHLPRKAFQTLGQHHWMQPTAAMKRLAHQSLAATV